MESKMDIQSASSLLSELAEVAQEASLTGFFQGGEQRVSQRYNQVIANLVEQGLLPDGMFSPLGAGDSFGVIAMEARLAASFLKKKKRGTPEGDMDLDVITRLAPFVHSDDLRDLIKSTTSEAFTPDFLTNIAPFLDRDSISEMLRAHLGRAISKPPSAPAPPEPPAAAEVPEAPPEPAVTAFASEQSARNVARLVSRLSEAGLSEADRQSILRQIAEAARTGG